MRLNCPNCGSRDSREFTYMGSAKLLLRPHNGGVEEFHDYVHLRDNPAGDNQELWQHTLGCSAWIVVHRNTVSHDVQGVRLAEQEAGS